MLMNLGASLNKVGNNALIIDAATSSTSVSSMLGVPQNRTLLDGVRLGKNIQDGVREMPHGFSLATLMRDQQRGNLSSRDKDLLDAAIRGLAKSHDVLLVDAELDAEDMLPVPILCDAHIVIQLSTTAESIKNAYVLIKRVGNQLGRRPFSLLFTSATDKDGAKVFDNMSKAATRYLAIQISSFGCVPDDESILKAVKLKRSVVEAFPMAQSAAAFRRIAQQVSEAVV
jgi:flagellar biosynthesis protein FlhG